MTRDITNDLLTASQNETFKPILFVKLEYESGNVLIHSDIGNIDFGGDTYLGVGDLGSISKVSESSELQSTAIDLILSGINTALVSVQLNEHYQGRPGTVYLGAKNLTTNELIVEPTIVFKGLMDNSKIEIGTTATISLRLNNRLAEWDKQNDRRYNNDDQQEIHPDDKAFEFIEGLAEKEIAWGKPVDILSQIELPADMGGIFR